MAKQTPLLVTALIVWSGQAVAQDPPLIRSIEANFTTNTIVADGVISPGEWDGAAAGGGQWRILRQPETSFDIFNNRFSVLWDNTNLYILYETDFTSFNPNPFIGNPLISFGTPNINFYFDPNRDGDLNIDGETGLPADPFDDTFVGVDGYQLAFNTPEGSYISTGADRQGVGFFTEAHVGDPFGDQANWNGPGANPEAGPALNSRDIVVGQVNDRSSGGVAEIIIPFADLDADEFVPAAFVADADEPTADYNGDGTQDAADYTVWRDSLGEDVGGAGNDELDGADGNDNGVVDIADYQLWADGFGNSDLVPSGLNATDGPSPGDVWGFNAGLIQPGLGGLPIWSWHDDPSTSDGDVFARWPHGELTFVGPPAASVVPEPGAAVLACSGLLGVLGFRRRR